VVTVRPPDPAVVGTTMRYMQIGSAEAVRRLVDLAFRDAHTALDLTYAHRGFWADPLPPGLVVTGNDIDPESTADLHVDFRSTGLPDSAYDLVIFDPPHVADGGKAGIMARRYGTVRGTAALRALIEAGCHEAWRVAAIGVLIKVADHSHQGEEQALSEWVKAAIGARVYTLLHSFRPGYLRDGKHRVERVPRNNGATWLAFRKDGHRHLNFDRLYERQNRGAA
jgi:hypothetical protein